MTTDRTRGHRPRRRGDDRCKVGRACGGDRQRLLQGDCIEVLAGLPGASVDAVVCDPPYGIGYQNERWDSTAIREAAARHGHARLSANEAFEVWCSLWAAECGRVMKPGAYLLAFGSPRTQHRLACGIEDARLEIRDTLMWLYGSGLPVSRHYPGGRTATLKPAYEPILLARRHLDGTTSETLERHGTAVLNSAACEVNGRHPANVIVGHEGGCGDDHCVPGCAVGILDEETAAGSASWVPPSRFLYCPKPSRAERDAGCEGLPRAAFDLLPNRPGWKQGGPSRVRNPHPTLKPLRLMRWLVRLVCPPEGLVLDPFMGSGTTGVAAVLEGRRFCGVELDERYIEIARSRIVHWGRQAGRGASSEDGGPVPLGRRRRR